MSERLRLLDLFCGAGGAGMGYSQAGFEVVGVDCNPQPRYPFEFHQADAFEFLEQHGHEFDVIHASPPCQAYSVSTRDKTKHPDLVAIVRDRLISLGKPYVIENVPGAPLRHPVTLCGTMFGLQADGLHVRRHRLFESPQFVFGPGMCTCRSVQTGQITGHLTGNEQYAARHRKPSFERAKRMMGIDWMDKKTLVLAIPPAYTKWIGEQLLKIIKEPS